MTGTMLDHWRAILERYPDKVAVRSVDGRESWTYGRLWHQIKSLGSLLLATGLEPGDRVGLLSAGFRREYLEAEQAIMVAGLVRVPIDPSATQEEVQAQLSHAGARMVMFEPAFADIVTGLEKSILALELGSPRISRQIQRMSGSALPTPRSSHLASLNFTGGTTGSPKAVSLTHGNLSTVIKSVNATRSVSSKETLLNVRPMWPISGVLVAIHLLAGSAVVLGDAFEASTFPDVVEQSSPSCTSLVPTMLVRLLAQPDAALRRLGSLRTIDIGAAGVPRHRMEEAVQRIGPRFGAVYGLTEAPWTCYRSPEELISDDGSLTFSVGRPVDGYDVCIEDNGVELEVGETGEVVIAGKHVMAGYWKDKAATEKVLFGGRFHTGDLGRFDEHGQLHLEGRTKEGIRTGGRTVEPREVEDVIWRVPGVAEVAVVGLPSDEWGEQVIAAVVSSRSDLTEREIIEACGAALAPYKKPRAVTFLESLPRSHYGKVLRADLRASLLEQISQSSSTLSEGGAVNEGL